jgi:uncharacterized 2Fe-2S/4Fe-4S cluster protein (DUF4445 family)
MSDSEKKVINQLLNPEDLDPMVRKVFLKVPEPSLHDNRGDVDRLLDTLEKEQGILNPYVSLDMAKEISGILHGSEFQITLTLAQSHSNGEVIDAEAGDTAGSDYGIAVDLGSTNIIFYLLNLSNGALLDQVSHENPQIQHGEDILSRIHHCERPDGLLELQEQVISAFNFNIDAMLRKHGIARRHLYALSVAGNTTMIHLFLGLYPLRICREPYIPVINRPEIYPARPLGLDLSPHARLYILPNVGSYVGGDVLAGILVSGMHKAEELSILVDVGTNAEIVLGNRHWLMVAAGAAGPALEGGVVKCGMRAAEGAIEKVRIHEKTFKPSYSTIGGKPPLGICGSGLIDLMAELFAKGVIDERGKIVVKSDCVVDSDDVRAYRVVPEEESGSGREILLSELDINNLLRTKGAMYTALTVITRHAGISFQDVKHFYVAGTFGAYIDPQMALTIGMVPDIPLERYRPLHNSAGTGACLCLLSNDKRRELEEISRFITYLELNVDGDFMNLMNAAMFLPHTDISKFPSVARPRS